MKSFACGDIVLNAYDESIETAILTVETLQRLKEEKQREKQLQELNHGHTFCPKYGTCVDCGLVKWEYQFNRINEICWGWLMRNGYQRYMVGPFGVVLVQGAGI